VGFSGHFVTARSARPLSDATFFGADFRCSEGHGDCVQDCQPLGRDWRVAQVLHGLPGDDYFRWLSALTAATGSPVMIATVMDSDVREVQGMAPGGSHWSAFLDPTMAASRCSKPAG